MRENISSLKKHVLWGSHISFYELMTYVKLTDSKIIIIIIMVARPLKGLGPWPIKPIIGP